MWLLIFSMFFYEDNLRQDMQMEFKTEKECEQTARDLVNYFKEHNPGISFSWRCENSHN